jgi:hypothetical protein
MRKCDTDYKNVFDDYVYYVICYLFTNMGRLPSWTSRFVDYLFLCLLLSWAYSRSFYVCKNRLHIHLAKELMGHWWYQPSLSGIIDDSTSVDSHSAVYHPLSDFDVKINVSWLKFLNSVQEIIHKTPLAYRPIVWQCTGRTASHMLQNVVNFNDVVKQDRIVIFSQHRTFFFTSIGRCFIVGIIKQLNTHLSAYMVK